MTEVCDKQLLTDYVTTGSEKAFETLVHRHLNLVYSTALRHVGNAEDAKEVAQAVFILLAQKAAALHKETVLSGWLYQTARLTSMTFLRTEYRRRRREEEAMMESIDNQSHAEPSWHALAPHLDDAVAKLSDKEKAALVMRFFEGRTFVEIATALGQNQSAIQKRVDRALDKIRNSFAKQGISISSARLANAIEAHASAVLPAALESTIMASTVTNVGAAKASTILLSQQTLKAYTYVKLKSAAIAVGSIAAIVLATAFLLHWSGTPNVLHAANDGVFELRSAGLNHGAPWVFIKSNAFTSSLGLQQNQNDAGASVSLVWLIGQAYDVAPARMVLPNAWPKDDSAFFPLNLTQKQRKSLQNTVRDTYLLAGKRETRLTDVYRLTSTSSEPKGLQITKGGAPDINLFTTRGCFYGTNVPISTLQEILENYLCRPVLNETHLTNHYDFRVIWNQQRGEQGTEALVQAIKEQLGLELVFDHAKLETLVVEEIKQ